MITRLLRALPIAMILVLLFAITLTGLYAGWMIPSPSAQVDPDGPGGLEPVRCWFKPGADWPATECYYMHVPEQHARPDGKVISFPVVVFRSRSLIATKSPVLHLGAGGPGASMHLDSTRAVKTIWEYHDDLSLKQGRDLYVIDPRGAGLARPLLTCDTFVDNVVSRLERNLTLEQERTETERDYYHCIDQFKSQGINLAAYNSLSIARDIEMLRRAVGVEKWVLIGVSYSTRYAQMIADEYPATVESMVLDSAVFPGVEAHENFIEHTLAPFRALYDYCKADPDCEVPLLDIEQRIASLYRELNRNPLRMRIQHPYSGGSIPVVLNGERFIEAVLNGVYGEQIFLDIPRIIVQLEQRRHEAITPYLQDYVAYLLDRNFGDVSADSHYCYEEKPFTDIERMRSVAQSLPEGFIKDRTLLMINWPDYCDRMQVPPGDTGISLSMAIPALFLHGELDTVTPLDDVLAHQKNFKNSKVITYKLSHDVLGSTECAEFVAARFIDNNAIAYEDLNCD